jgi:hypothetical protein
VIKRILNDDDFLIVSKMVHKYLKEGKDSLSRAVGEIASCCQDESYVGLYSEEGYLCGHFIDGNHFLVTQAYSKSPKVSKEFSKMIDELVSKSNCHQILAYTYCDPRVYRKYGYKLLRHIIIKEV